MIKEFKVGEKRYGLIKGERQSIITETDCCHVVFENDEPQSLSDAYFADTEREVDINQIEGDPVSIPNWIHYFGIKPRVRNNYNELLESMREIGVDTSSMPDWDKELRRAG